MASTQTQVQNTAAADGNVLAVADMNQTNRTARRTVQASAFLSAVLIFVLMNAALRFINPVKFDPYVLPYRDWIWWSINDLRISTGAYNVVLFGSSLVIAAVNSCDANYLNKSLDQIQYHGASYLDHCLTEKFGGKFHSFNLATPGQTPADAYVSLRSMVQLGKKPDIVIYGIAPRDLIDSTMHDAADGEPYRYLSRVLNYNDIDPQIAYHAPIDKLGYFLQRNVYLCGNAVQLQMLGANVTNVLLNKLLPCPPRYDDPFTWWDRVKILPQYKAGDVNPGACMAQPDNPAVNKSTLPKEFLDNTKDYQARYHNPRRWMYDTQVYFLKKLMGYCAAQHINLFLVNMPITSSNTKLLRPGAYETYVQEMATVAAAQHTEFFNLCNFEHYHMPLFGDYVHLNGNGGKVFVDDLVNRLAQSPTANLVFARAAGQVQSANHFGK